MNILLLGGNGYIGSLLYERLKVNHTITSVDLCLFGKNLKYSLKFDYEYADISGYDAIICLAGHSSVQLCEQEPIASWDNNVNKFHTLCQNLGKDQLLIYASSASVYGRNKGISSEELSLSDSPLKDYDLQKTTIDLIANRFILAGKKIIGLRFGTVNGAAPNTRSELMINSMTKSAIENKFINICNLKIRRGILGVTDAARAIEKIIERGTNNYGQYNLCSFNSTVEEISEEVSKVTNSKLVIIPDSPAYDYAISVDKFKNEFQFEFKDTLQSLIEELIQNHYNLNYDHRLNFHGQE